MRLPILLAVLSTTLLACGARNVAAPNSPRQSRGEVYEEALDEASDPDANQAPEPVQSDEVDLDHMAGELPPAAPERAPHPLLGKSSADIEAILLRDAAELGPASLGKTNRGSLFGGVQMQPSEAWRIVNPRETWGTQETIDYLSYTIKRVGEIYPDTPPINVGDISRPKGGHFSPHLSHQSGRDVDLGFYYNDGSAWYAKADASNLDLPRTWALLKITVTETDVEAIFLDRSIQRILRDYASELGESEEWLDQVFGGPSSNLRPLVIHEDGHQTHLHIRYYNPIAQETGRRVYKALIKYKKIKPPTYYKQYKVKRGDSLIRIAKKFKTNVKTLRKANRLRSNRIYAGRTYKIPRKGGVVQPPKLVLPERRVPTRLAKFAPASAVVSEAANEPTPDSSVVESAAHNAGDSASTEARSKAAAPAQ